MTREAKLAVGVGDLLDSEQHGRRLQGQQLTQTSDGGILPLKFLLRVKPAEKKNARLWWDVWYLILALQLSKSSMFYLNCVVSINTEGREMNEKCWFNDDSG